MLTEQFIASIGPAAATAKTPHTAGKDAAIFQHEYQPLRAQRAVFKNSATPPNCLAVSKTHIFVAQSEKAVVHVYSREKGNQESIVPFTERIACLTLACDDAVLVLGTVEGRLFLWELATGRQITTTQAHLQAVAVVVADATSNFLLSASKDSTVHVWSIPSLLSFSNTTAQSGSPLRSFTTHRSPVSALALGHSSSFCNFAVSSSMDRTCHIWDYHRNTVLRTFLLPSVPTSLKLEAADRAIYAGYEDGSIQQLNLYSDTEGGMLTSIHNGDISVAPIQPSRSSHWTSVDSPGAILSLSVSFDGSTILSGHESGEILVWDTAKAGRPVKLLQARLPGPVTNLHFLPVSGFPSEQTPDRKLPAVIKPRFAIFDSSTEAVPHNYALQMELTSNFIRETQSKFERALTAPSFPTTMTDHGLTELLSWQRADQGHVDTISREEDDGFMALEDRHESPPQLSLERQNVAARAEIEALRRLQTASFAKIDRLNAEKKALLQREQKRIARQSKGQASQVNGIHEGLPYKDVSIDRGSSDED